MQVSQRPWCYLGPQLVTFRCYYYRSQEVGWELALECISRPQDTHIFLRFLVPMSSSASSIRTFCSGSLHHHSPQNKEPITHGILQTMSQLQFLSIIFFLVRSFYSGVLLTESYYHNTDPKHGLVLNFFSLSNLFPFSLVQD